MGSADQGRRSRWPAPTPDAVNIGDKGSRTSPSTARHGAVGWKARQADGADDPRRLLETGGSWTEFVRNVGQLPARGAYYIATSAKIVDMSGGLSRALAIKPQGPGLGDS